MEVLKLFLVALSIYELGATKNVDEYVSYISDYISKTSSYSLLTDNSIHLNTLDDSVNDYGTFDFIVVGGGAGGTLMARRLSEILGWSVLLLEAGGLEDDFTDVPALNYYLRSTPMNWGYFTKPQTRSCQGMEGKKCVYPTGKVLGGSCVLGDMVYARGNKADFDKWASLTNDNGWSYEEVLPYFMKTEQVQISTYDEGFHGHDGEFKINYTSPDPVNYDSFVNANIAMGILESDPNGRNQSGVSRFQWTIDFNKRQTGGNTLIVPIMDTRTNLNVSLNSFATKIVFQDMKAVGVEFVKDGKKYTASTTKEVILSAGAINSPQLLMLSGVGPKEELSKHGIEVINDLPVGKNLKDHPVFLPMYIRTNNPAAASDLTQQVADYLKGQSPLTAVFSASPVAFINTKDLSSTVPNCEILFINPPQSVPADTSMFYNLDAKHQKMFGDFNTSSDHLVYVVNIEPKSTGSVTLKSSNIADFPIIDPAYYSDPNNEDIEVIYEGIQYVLNLIKTEPLRALNATLIGVAPECAIEKECSEREYWMCAIKYLTSTLYHPTCTTRMGTSPTNSVVDTSLKVHNMKGIRVVDGGSMPEIVGGHTFAAIYMMAERAFDLIKAEYGA